MPGISPARSGPRRGLAALGGFGVPPRSSFGARLRSRVPQYGHSVMYGDTSRPQLLQTTKRSGPLAMGDRFYAAWGLGPRRFHDLAHDLRVVVVRLVDHGLPVGAVAVLQQVEDALELCGRAELLRMLAQAVVEPAG